MVGTTDPLAAGKSSAIFETVQSWLSPGLLVTMSVVSVVLFVLGVVAVPWIVARLPEDYLARLGTLRSATNRSYVVLVLRNVAGVLLLLAGVAMLVLPGQGILTILVGLLLMDFPKKQNFQRWALSRPLLWRSLNRMRRRLGRPPLLPPLHAEQQ
jgi:hypothetical protein